MDRNLLTGPFVTGPFPAKLEVAETRALAEVFKNQIESIGNLLQIPYLLILVRLFEVEHLTLFTKAVAVDSAYKTWSKSSETKQIVEERIRTLKAEREKDPTAESRLTRQVEVAIDAIMRDDGVRLGLEAMANAAVASLWTAYECTCRDAWVVALNSRTLDLGQKVLAALEGEQSDADLSRRAVSVGLLARYGFDLRQHLGSVLAPKFDFSAVSGIRTAYRAAFGRDSAVAAAVDSPLLRNLEALRHLIVHSAGRVDEEYKRRSGSPAAIGSRVEISKIELAEYLKAVTTAGSTVLTVVDEWLAGETTEESS